MSSTALASLLGLSLALYALHVEANASVPGFSALCDLTIPLTAVGLPAVEASCSATLASPEARLLSFLSLVPADAPAYLNPPNALLGAAYYAALLLLPPSPVTRLLACVSLCATLFLAKVLVGKREVCLLCISSHLVNAFLFYKIVIARVPKSKRGKRE